MVAGMLEHGEAEAQSSALSSRAIVGLPLPIDEYLRKGRSRSASNILTRVVGIER